MAAKVKRFFYYLRLFPYFVSRSLQARMAYKVDFFLGVGASILMQLLGFVFIWTIFQNIPDINGWGFYQMAFVYGMAAIPLGLNEFLFAGTWAVPRYIGEGSLDRLLLRPLSTIFSIMAADVTLHGLGSVLFGLAVCIYSLVQLELVLSPLMVLFWICAILCGTLIQYALNMLMATLSFWVINSQSAMVLVQNISEFSKYPIAIYQKGLQLFLSFVVPYAFCSFYPSSFLLGVHTDLIYWAGPFLAAGVMLLISWAFWRFALSQYQSAGG